MVKKEYNMNSLISIIIPVYNAEYTLNRCIDSILNQTFQDWELLLINDGSIDQSGKLCDQYAVTDQRIKVFHKENEGVSVARNLGIKESTGEYITFIDADDEVVKDYLAILYENIQQSDIVFFFFKWIYTDNSKLVILLDNFYSEERISIEKEMSLLMNNKIGYDLFGFTWNKIFKSYIIKKNNIRFVKGLATSEDEVFTLDYCRYIRKLKVINLPLYIYHISDGGLTYKKKSSSEWMLLAAWFNCLMKEYADEGIKVYLSKRIKTCLLNAVNCDKPLIYKFYIIVSKVIRFCIKNNIPVPYRAILRILVLKR